MLCCLHHLSLPSVERWHRVQSMAKGDIEGLQGNPELRCVSGG